MPGDVRTLQCTYGNRAVTQLLARSPLHLPIQAKLTVSPAGDKYEHEADQVARQVVSQLNASAPSVQYRYYTLIRNLRKLADYASRTSDYQGTVTVKIANVEKQSARGIQVLT